MKRKKKSEIEYINGLLEQCDDIRKRMEEFEGFLVGVLAVMENVKILDDELKEGKKKHGHRKQKTVSSKCTK